jgi:hypothetical protein
LVVTAARVSHSGELGALGLRRALDASANAYPVAAIGSSAGNPRGADGTLTISWDPPPHIDLNGDDDDDE